MKKTAHPPTDLRDPLERAAAEVLTHLDREGTLGLGELLDHLCREDGACAPLLNFAESLRESSGDGESGVRTALAEALEASAHHRVANAAGFASLVHEYRWTSVAASGFSPHLLECLASGRAAGLAAAVVAEGGPGGGGLDLVRALRGEGFSVVVTADTALPSFLIDLDAVVVSARAALGAWFVAPAGTATLLREARVKSCNRVVLVPPLARLSGESLSAWRDPGLEKPTALGRLPKGATWAGSRYERVPWDLANFVLGR